MASTTPQPGSPQQHHVGEHWSGANPIPTIQKFVEHLDSEKRERDRRVDEENRTKEENAKKEEAEGKHGDVAEHQPREISQAKIRTVTDPTTGRDIGVEDQDESSMAAIKDPKVVGFLGPSWKWYADRAAGDGSKCQYWTADGEHACYISVVMFSF